MWNATLTYKRNDSQHGYVLYSRDTKSEVEKYAAKDAEYYRSIGYEIVELTTYEVCNMCQGDKRVPRKNCKKLWGRVDSDLKRCPACKGKGV